MRYAQVVVDTMLAITRPRAEEAPLAESSRERAFTYAIPAHLEGEIAAGQLVTVPFGSRRLQGVVLSLSDTSPVAETKEIEALADSQPWLSPAHIDLAHWMARTYLCSINDAVQLMLPPGLAQQSETILSLAPGASGEGLGPKPAALVEWLAQKGETRKSRLPRELRSAADAAVRRGWVLKRTVLLPPRARPKHTKSVRLVATEAQLQTALTSVGRRNPAADVLDLLAGRDPAAAQMTVEQVRAETGCTLSALASLERAGLIERVPGREWLAATPLYLENVPALSPNRSRAMVYLRERGTPAPLDELTAALKMPPSVIRALELKGYIERTCSDPAVKLKVTSQEAREQARRRRGATRDTEILALLRSEPGPVWISALYAATGCTLQDLKKLQAAGLIALEEEETWRDPLAGRVFDSAKPPTLTPEQDAAVAQVVARLGLPGAASGDAASPVRNSDPAVFLLHGVTGSGKTEVYLRVLAEALKRGQQGILLVPEIALTPQTVRRLGARFPDRMAVLHSRLSVGERYDTWRRCRQGLVDVVIGSRSALFAPLPRLGLIVMDEEHEPAYKQESAPHYHARAAAIELARRTGAVVLLGSATPDLESYYRAVRGEYHLLELPQRLLGFGPVSDGHSPAPYADLPPVQIVDLRAELKAGNRSIFSVALRGEMARALSAREQIILFLNRRGSATMVLCRDCGYVCKCRRCDNPMTLHLDAASEADGAGQLICHHCNRRERVPTRCPRCGSGRIRYFGMGTQKVEQEIHALFPEARLLRWDYDVTRGKEAHEEILQTFVEHRADILIGTQMIAKGLDLPRVTLVGVISADTALHLPDFRAGERTFQLLTQVAGRAGRSALGGKVILQTYQPEHYALQAASHHDYRAFYASEIAFRRAQDYPPFSRLIRLIYTNKSDRAAQEEAARMHGLLALRIAQRGLPALELIGPAPAFFHRLRGEYRHQILVKGPDPNVLLEEMALPLGWRADVDPVSLL